MVPPIVIQFMIECVAAARPGDNVGGRVWNSPAGTDTRAWLRAKHLIDENERATSRGRAWLDAIQRTPLPPISAQQADAAGSSKALTDIMNERARQVNEEGWTPAHDDQHADFSLPRAAIAYAACAAAGPIDRTIIDAHGAAGLTASLKALWPIGWSTRWFKPTSRRRDLIKAAALLVAEIERLDRMERQP